MTTRDPARTARLPSRAVAEDGASALVECSLLSKSFGGVRAVSEVNAAFEAGKIAALIGPNGAGKTTLFHLISGALRPDSGEVRYMGSPITGLAPWEVARRGVGRLFQDTRVFARLSVLDNVLLAIPDRASEEPWRAVLTPFAVTKATRTKVGAARRWLDLVGLGDDLRRPAQALSFGQQRLLAMARLLASDAQVFLLDEPSAGINTVLMERLLRIVRDVAAAGKTVLMIEHNMSVVVEVADWVYFMDEGEISAFGPPGDILNDPRIRARYLGL